MLARVLAGPLRLLGPIRVCALVVLLTVSFGGISATANAISSVEGGNSFNELSQKAQQQEPTKTTQTTETAVVKKKETGTSRTTIFIGIVAAIVLLLAIAYVIVRDARKRAPAEDPGDLEARENRDLALHQRKRRAKAKAARQQRKRNR
jgi:hypothetical protein